MAQAKRQGREKPAKIEQRKVKGRSEDWRPQVEPTALLANPIYIEQAWGKKKNI